MKKILLVSDGVNLNMNTVDFACYLAKLTHSRLSAIFIEHLIEEEELALKDRENIYFVESIANPDLPENKNKSSRLAENERLFGMACSNRGVNTQVTRINEPSANSIVEESRFADLLIINADTSFEDRPEGSPSQFVKEILAETECAVILAPYSFFGVDEILLTYDGSKSSVFAIKQFAYLFPELKDKKVNLVQIDEEELVDSTETEKIRELLKLHFPNFEIQHIKGKPADELFGYLLGRKNLFVVMGAYGRTLLSNLFRPSAASLVVKAINLPLFIAHYQ